MGNIKNWRVSGEETLCWHRIIEYKYMERVKEVAPKVNGGSRINEVTLNLFQEKFSVRVRTELEVENQLYYGNYLKLVTKCCDEVFPKINARQGRRKKVYWWCEAVKEKRMKCIKRRRRMTRANREGNEESTAATVREYKSSKRDYNREMLQSKKRSWLNMPKDLDTDEWGGVTGWWLKEQT